MSVMGTTKPKEGPSGEFERVARKEYDCHKCSKKIKPGEVYVLVRVAPWDNWDGDVTDDGHMIGFRSREPNWRVDHYHRKCHWWWEEEQPDELRDTEDWA